MAELTIKLYYGKAKGRAELIRLVLSAAGKQFEDIRFGMADWPKYKTDSPFGQMPLVDIDGKRYAQCLAIVGYFAREFGLHGKTNLEMLQVDQVLQLFQDLLSLAVKNYYEKDEAKKKESMAAFKETDSPKFFGHIERLLKENGTGYLVGSELTAADIAVLDSTNGTLGDIICSLDDFPLVKSLTEKVLQNEGINTYVANRPPHF